MSFSFSLSLFVPFTFFMFMPKTISFVKLASSLFFEGSFFLFCWITVNSNFLLNKFNSLVYFFYIIGWKQFDFLELIDYLYSMVKLLLFRFLVFLFLFCLFFWGLLVNLALFRSNNLGSTLDLFLPLFTKFDLSNLFLSFLLVFCVWAKIIAITYQYFTKVNFSVIRITIYVVFSLFLQSQFSLLLLSLSFFFILFPLLFSLLILFLFFKFTFLIFFLFFLSAFFLFFFLLYPLNLLFHPTDVSQKILLVFIIINITLMLVNIIIYFIFYLVSFSINCLNLLIIFFFNLFDCFLLSNIALLTFFLLFQNIKLGFNSISLCNFVMKFSFNRLEFLIKDINLILQFPYLRLDLNAGSCLLQSSLQFIDLIIQASFLSLIYVSCCKFMFFTLNSMLKFLQRITFTAIRFPKLIKTILQNLDISTHSFFNIIKSSNLFSKLIFDVEFIFHNAGILSNCHSSSFFAFSYIANDVSLLIDQILSLKFYSFSLCLQFLQALVMFFLVWLLEDFLWCIRDFGLFCDFLLFPIKFRSCVSWRSFFFRSLILWFFFFLIFILLQSFLFNFLLVLRLLIQRFGWIYQSFLNIFFEDVLRHYI